MRVLYAATTHDRLRSYPFNLLLGLYNYMGRFACFPNKKTRIVGPFICRQKRIVAQFQFHDRSLVSHLTIDSTAYPFFFHCHVRGPHASLSRPFQSPPFSFSLSLRFLFRDGAAGIAPQRHPPARDDAGWGGPCCGARGART